MVQMIVYIALITIGVFVPLAIYTTIKGQRTALRKYFIAMCASIIGISIGKIVLYITPYMNEGALISMICVVSLVHYTYFLSSEVSEKLKKFRNVLNLLSAAVIGIIVLEYARFRDLTYVWGLVLGYLTVITFFSSLGLFLRHRRAIKAEKYRTGTIFLGVVIPYIYILFATVIPRLTHTYEEFTPYPALMLGGIFIAYGITRFRLFMVKIIPETHAGQRSVNFEPVKGRLYILKGSEKSTYSFFRGVVAGKKGLILTIKYPRYIQKKYRFQKTPMIWLTNLEGKYPASFRADRLDFEISYAIIKFIKEGGETVFIDGIEYLSETVGKKQTYEFLKMIYDLTIETSVFIRLRGDSGMEEFVSLAEEVIDFKDGNKCAYLLDQRDFYKKLRSEKEISYFITKINPAKIEKEKSTSVNTIWISNIAGVPVEKIDLIVPEIIKRKKSRDIFLEGLEYYSLVKSKRDMIQFIKNLDDIAATKGGNLYILKFANDDLIKPLVYTVSC